MGRGGSGISLQTNRINAWPSSSCHCSKRRIYKILIRLIWDKQMQKIMREFESNHRSFRWVIQKLSGLTINNFVVIPTLTHLPCMWLYYGYESRPIEKWDTWNCKVILSPWCLKEKFWNQDIYCILIYLSILHIHKFDSIDSYISFLNRN